MHYENAVSPEHTPPPTRPSASELASAPVFRVHDPYYVPDPRPGFHIPENELSFLEKDLVKLSGASLNEVAMDIVFRMRDSLAEIRCRFDPPDRQGKDSN